MSVRILVVDDVPERIEDLEDELAFSFPGANIELLGASDVPSAMRVFSERGPFDIVVLDVHLPAFGDAPIEGGLYLLKNFSKVSPSTLYIISSGTPPALYDLPTDVSAWLPAENFSCIPKDAPRDRLVEEFRRIVDRKKCCQNTERALEEGC